MSLIAPAWHASAKRGFGDRSDSDDSHDASAAKARRLKGTSFAASEGRSHPAGRQAYTVGPSAVAALRALFPAMNDQARARGFARRSQSCPLSCSMWCLCRMGSLGYEQLQARVRVHTHVQAGHLLSQARARQPLRRMQDGRDAAAITPVGTMSACRAQTAHKC